MKRVFFASLAFLSTLTITGMEQAPSPAQEAEFPKEFNGHLTPLLYHGITKTAQANPTMQEMLLKPKKMIELLDWTAENARYLAHAVDLAERLQKHTQLLPAMQDSQTTSWISQTQAKLEDGDKMHASYFENDEHLKKITELLKKRTLDLNHLSSLYGLTALSCKIKANNPKAEQSARMLLAAGASTVKETNKNKPLDWAIRSGNISMIKLLLESGVIPRPHQVNKTTFETRSLLMQTVQKYENVASRGRFTSLFFHNHEYQHFRHIIAYGIITTAAIDTSFANIINRPSIMLKTLNWFIKRISPAQVLSIAERFELERESLPVMKHQQIIDWKTQIKTRLEGGQELFHAAATNDPNAVENLLGNKNLDLNWQGRLGSTALMEAIVRRHTKIAQLLINAGANSDLQDIAGNTPLHIAAAQGNTEICKYLLHAQANLDAQNEDGRTPLMESVANNHAEVSKLLIDASAKTDSKDKSGNTTSRIAEAKGNHRAAVARLVIPEIEEIEKELRFLEKVLEKAEERQKSKQ
jgi:ankyrin repeat protein